MRLNMHGFPVAAAGLQVASHTKHNIVHVRVMLVWITASKSLSIVLTLILLTCDMSDQILIAKGSCRNVAILILFTMSTHAWLHFLL